MTSPRRDPDSPSARRADRRARAEASLGAVIADGRLVTRPLAGDGPSALPRTLVIACGALMTELFAVAQANGWSHLHVTGIPASYHNRPERIGPAVQAKIRAARSEFERILVAFGDCGTGGALDQVLAEEQVARIEGAHCYAFFTGLDAFEVLQDGEVGTFYLTDFLALHFETLLVTGLSLDRHPDLLRQFFGNYTRVVHLSQIPNPEAAAAAARAAARLGLPLVTVDTGLGGLAGFLAPAGGADAKE